MHFKMSSAICFHLDQSKILSSGNGLKDTICEYEYFVQIFMWSNFQYYNAEEHATGFYVQRGTDNMTINFKYFDFPGFNDSDSSAGLKIYGMSNDDFILSLPNNTSNMSHSAKKGLH